MTDKPRNLVANPQVVLREEFDDWAVLFNPDTTDAFGLNPVAVFIWKQIAVANSIANIVENIKTEYEDVSDTVEKDIHEFIDNVIERGLAGYELS